MPGNRLRLGAIVENQTPDSTIEVDGGGLSLARRGGPIATPVAPRGRRYNFDLARQKVRPPNCVPDQVGLRWSYVLGD